jgi:branched-chain amino acid transport system substrate-binding protein
MDATKMIKLLFIGVFFFSLFLMNNPLYVMAAEVVKIGVILPLSGSLAPIGKTAKFGLDYGASEINESGGIKSLGGAKIQLVYGDSTGKPEVGLSEAEKLILKENVVGLMGTYQSSVTYTTTEVAERYKVPYLVIISTMPEITERGFKYVFRPTQKATHQASAQVDYLTYMGKKTGKEVKTVALLYENTDFGQGNAKVWKEFCAKYGFKIVLDEPYPHASTDLTPVVMKLKDKKPDAVLNSSYLSDIILLVKAVADLKFRYIAWVCAGGELDPKFTAAVGDLANYYFTVTPWQPDVIRAKPWVAEVNKGFKAKTGDDLTTVSAMTYSNIYTFKDALERAASTDRENIRNSLATTKIASGKAMILPFEKIEFDQTGQNPYQRMIVSQFLNKEIRIVYPEEFAAPGIKAVWPHPSWTGKN